MKTAGTGKTMVFLITDTQIKEESFLEDIDNLLNTGEVPNIFAADEKSEIMEVYIQVNVLPFVRYRALIPYFGSMIGRIKNSFLVYNYAWVPL